ncbi:MAG TPA: outer membrane beta-barrel protein [Nitrospiria bacterium]
MGTCEIVKGELIVEPAMSFTETFDDNIFSSGSDRESDYITSISPTLRVSYQWPLVSTALTYRGSLDVYADHSQLNRYNQNGGLDLNLDRLLNRFNKRGELTFTERFVITPDLPDYELDPGVVTGEDDGTQVGRNTAFRNHFGAEYRYQLSRRAQASLEYTNTLTEYSDPTLVDRFGQSLKSTYAYQLFRNDTMTLAARYQNVSFDGEDSSDTYLATLGWRHIFSSTFSFQVEGGVLHLAEAGTEEYRPFFSGNIDKGFLLERNTKINFSYNQDIRSTGLVNRLVQHQNVRVSLSKSFTQFLTGQMGGSYGTNKTIKGGEVDIQFFRLNATLNYLFNKWLSGNVSYTHNRQVSGGNLGEDLYRNRVQMQLLAIFPSF